MKLYTVSDEYINHLRTVEPKVPYNTYADKKPFVGVVLEINDKKYLAPLTSPKEQLKTVKNSCPSIFKLHAIDDESEPLGAIRIQYMIPVLESEITELDPASRGEHYENLINKQMIFIRKHEDEIKLRANKLYTKAKNVPFFTRISCNFYKLEIALTTFNEKVA